MWACTVASERFAVRIYHALVLLHSAHEAGVPQTGNVRA